MFCRELATDLVTGRRRVLRGVHVVASLVLLLFVASVLIQLVQRVRERLVQVLVADLGHVTVRTLTLLRVRLVRTGGKVGRVHGVRTVASRAVVASTAVALLRVRARL